jgi:transposase
VRDSEAEIAALRDDVWRSPEQVRANAALLMACGYSAREIAKVYGVSTRTVTKWRQRAKNKGPPGLRGKPRGRPRKLTEQQLSEIEAAVGKEPSAAGFSGAHWTGRMLVAWIDRQFERRVSERQARRLVDKFAVSRRRRKKQASISELHSP